MEPKFSSWQLTEFNLQGQIKLENLFGLIRIYRTDDNKLILVEEDGYGVIDQQEPVKLSFLKPESVLGFVLDIGIQKELRLTYGHGFYFGHKLIETQSAKSISQSSFDADLFDRIGTKINTDFKSGDKTKELNAIRIQLLFDTYNNARLIYPRFHSESYLSLMRILDAIGECRTAFEFAAFVAQISKELNREIYDKLKSVKAFEEKRIPLALELYDECLQKAKKNKLGKYFKTLVSNASDADKVMYACFYSAYQYRNKFVHAGFPFPDVVLQSFGLEEDRGTAYLSISGGISWLKIQRPEDVEPGDLIDTHEVIGESSGEFKEKYFLLLPTWYFTKAITRAALLSKFSVKT